MKKITPVFGPQELFDGADDDVEFAIEYCSSTANNGVSKDIHFIKGVERTLAFVQSCNVIKIAHRRIEEAQYSNASEKEIEDLIYDRDRWESKATELAHGIAEKFGTDFGEHSYDNCPVQNAVDFVFDLESTERIINEPKRWTVEDQKAGKLPEVGSEYNVDGCIVEHLGNGATGYENIFYFKYPSGACGNAHERLAKPIETPKEKAARLESEFIDSMVKELKVNIGSVSYQIVRSAIRHSYRKLSGELPPVQVKEI